MVESTDLNGRQCPKLQARGKATPAHTNITLKLCRIGGQVEFSKETIHPASLGGRWLVNGSAVRIHVNVAGQGMAPSFTPVTLETPTVYDSNLGGDETNAKD